MTQHLQTLVTKLNDTCRVAAERAAGLCLRRGHHEVDVEHLFLALLDDAGSDVSVLCGRSDIAPTALRRDLEAELGHFRAGNTRTPVFSERLPTLLEHAWLVASLDAHDARIRSGHLLLAVLTEPGLRQIALRGSPLFGRFPLDALQRGLDAATAGSNEGRVATGSVSSATPADRAAATPALDQFTTSLTAAARAGRLDPVIGREAEIRQTIDILMRRRQNNPILTGEAGVGKTAVVEGLALRIAAGEVPLALRGVELHTLDLGLLQAGASVKGEFESRLKNVIDEVRRSAHPVVLFIDEAHTLIGAGGAAGQNDAANLLKPALARGELRTIAATTWSEYKKYFEKDAALARRFQTVKVDEPSEPVAAAMLRGLLPLMERHFNVRVFDEAVTEAVRLSARYIGGRQLPDKAIGVLDTACAKVALGQSAPPAVIDDAVQALGRIETEIAGLVRESAAGRPHGAALEALCGRRDRARAELAALQGRHAAEMAQVGRILALRADIDAAPTEGERSAARTELQTAIDALARLQGETPLVPLQVDAAVVAEVVAAWTGVPLGRMVRDEIDAVLALDERLQARVVGQAAATRAVAARVRTARANLDDPVKPQAVFLFVGPSGVGKTETALALADLLYGGEKKLVTINMSEYQEAHSVSGLKGSPPGYVGYGEGGVLTEAVRRNPYSVVLLDEVEKAHPDVLELFFQVFDKGVLDDAEGRQVDFRNCIIILTSNVGSARILEARCEQPRGVPIDTDALLAALRPELCRVFKPAFLGRTTVVPYLALDDDVLERIVRLKLERIGQRIEANHKARFDCDPGVVATVLARCTEVASGARTIDHILNGSLLPLLADALLGRMAAGGGVEAIEVSTCEHGDFVCRLR